VTELVRVEIPRDEPDLVDFLCADEWPFHGRRQLSVEDVRGIDFGSADVASFWVVDGDERLGLIRIFDLGDIGEGAPRFDLRIAKTHRGRGYGTDAARWIVSHLFTTYPELHRAEANTRDDNAAMRAVLSRAGFTLEGRLRQSWRGNDEEGDDERGDDERGDGEQGDDRHDRWFDTLIYGILRSDWSPAKAASSAQP